MPKSDPLVTIELPTVPDATAPHGSKIRLLPGPTNPVASLVHCRLPSGRTASAISHRTVEEVWYVVAGHGELWRRFGDHEKITPFRPGSRSTSRSGRSFSFAPAATATWR
jgi:mannose-6-phosphate isomerase-like protein (cupin superfamily)